MNKPEQVKPEKMELTLTLPLNGYPI